MLVNKSYFRNGILLWSQGKATMWWNVQLGNGSFMNIPWLFLKLTYMFKIAYAFPTCLLKRLKCLACTYVILACMVFICRIGSNVQSRKLLKYWVKFSEMLIQWQSYVSNKLCASNSCMRLIGDAVNESFQNDYKI